MSSAKGLDQGGAHVRLHARERMRKIQKQVQEVPVVFAYIEGKEMARAIMPWPTSSENGELLGAILLGEVPCAYPPRGASPRTRNWATSIGWIKEMGGFKRRSFKMPSRHS